MEAFLERIFAPNIFLTFNIRYTMDPDKHVMPQEVVTLILNTFMRANKGLVKSGETDLYKIRKALIAAYTKLYQKFRKREEREAAESAQPKAKKVFRN